MSNYISGNRSTEKHITVIEPQALKPRRRGKKQNPQPATRLQANDGVSTTQSNLGTCKPPVDSNPPAVNPPDQPKKVSDVMLKIRFIHLLALRPYKKPELFDRIIEEGIRPCERNVMTTVLGQVTFVKNDTYHLQEKFLKNVQEEWPFYTEQEKAMLQRRKLQNLTPTDSSNGFSESSQSQKSTQSGSPPVITEPPASQLTSKRPADCQGEDDLPTKRPRISHCEKSEAGQTSSTMSFDDNRKMAGSSNDGDGVSGDGDNVLHASVAPSSCTPTSTVSLEDAEYLDFLTHYTTVSSIEQKLRYKADFAVDFEEYFKLHAELMEVWQRIADMEERLNQLRTSGNQNEFEEIKQQFSLEHSKAKNDPVRVQKERRFYYLHHKLGHIRRVVDEFDMINNITNMEP